MNKVTSLSIVFVTFFSMQLSATIDCREKGLEWKFLREKLIIKPHQEALSHNHWEVMVLLAFSALVPGGMSAMVEEKERLDAMLRMGCLGLIGGLLIKKLIIDPSLSKDAEFQGLLKFIQHWPQQKKYTPVCLHNAFDELYELHLHGRTSELHDEMYSIQRIIKQELSNRFPSRIMRVMKFLLSYNHSVVFPDN